MQEASDASRKTGDGARGGCLAMVLAALAILGAVGWWVHSHPSKPKDNDVFPIHPVVTTLGVFFGKRGGDSAWWHSSKDGSELVLLLPDKDGGGVLVRATPKTVSRSKVAPIALREEVPGSRGATFTLSVKDEQDKTFQLSGIADGHAHTLTIDGGDPSWRTELPLTLSQKAPPSSVRKKISQLEKK